MKFTTFCFSLLYRRIPNSMKQIYFEKLIVAQLGKPQSLMEPVGALPRSKGPTTNPYPEPDPF
jgi:hypothetical protein